MSASIPVNPISLLTLPAFRLEQRSPALGARLTGWVMRKSRRRLDGRRRALLRDRHPLAAGGTALVLDDRTLTAAATLATLRALPAGRVGTIVSVGALADAADVAVLLAEARRVLRPGGRLFFVEPVTGAAGTNLRRAQLALGTLWRAATGSANAPRDLWNDLKAARFAALNFQSVNLPGLAGLPVPHIVGEAVMAATTTVATVRPVRRHWFGVAAPTLAWDQPAFAFFG